MLAYPVVYSFIVSAEKYYVAFERKFVGNSLVEDFTVGRHVDYFVVFPFGLEFLDHHVYRLDHQHHARIPSVAVVIHLLAGPFPVFPEVVYVDFNYSLFLGASYDRVVQRTVEQFRKYCYYVYPHGHKNR